ncbi:formimidoylglutamase [Pseudoalteromonas mariniglutinosa]|uniref:formimidoylglutamase n=1 Tax=Pseudoalteromonas mariniglutinosa TaxID=206042 RepID=UPI00384C4567
MNEYLHIYDDAAIQSLCTHRLNERKAWQSIALLDTHVNTQQALIDAAAFGIRYVLLGICEDIGPRANLGNGGAQHGWQAFLKRFLNQPHNQFLPHHQVLLLGEVNLADINQQAQYLDNQDPSQLTTLRRLCADIDLRVEAILSMIFAAGLEPIIIGGGHNNCLGIIRAASKCNNSTINAINFDPHADFRACEGRHSGNGFRYAYQEGLLAHYHVIGLHELKNNQAIIDALSHANFSFTSYQAIQVRREITLSAACQRALTTLAHAPLGVEVDLDSISFMPVSAYTNCGFSVSDAEHFVHLAASQKHAHYLHLCEAAPIQHPSGLDAGLSDTGQVITALVNAYLQARITLKS